MGFLTLEHARMEIHWSPLIWSTDTRYVGILFVASFQLVSSYKLITQGQTAYIVNLLGQNVGLANGLQCIV